MKNLNLTIPLIFATVFCFIFLPGCNSKIGDASAPATYTFTQFYTDVLSANCIQCHAPGQSATTVNGTHFDCSTKDSAYITLVGTGTPPTVLGLSSNGSGQCNGVQLVKASSPQLSYIMATLFADYHTVNFAGATNCTPYSPHGTVSATDQTNIAAWISGGALNN